MKKIMTLLIGCSLALAVSAQTEQQDQKKKPVQKSKQVQKQQHAVTNTHAQGPHTEHAPNAHAKIQNPTSQSSTTRRPRFSLKRRL